MSSSVFVSRQSLQRLEDALLRMAEQSQISWGSANAAARQAMQELEMRAGEQSRIADHYQSRIDDADEDDPVSEWVYDRDHANYLARKAKTATDNIEQALAAASARVNSLMNMVQDDIPRTVATLRQKQEAVSIYAGYLPGTEGAANGTGHLPGTTPTGQPQPNAEEMAARVAQAMKCTATLDEDQWTMMSDQERLDNLRQVAGSICQTMGIDTPSIELVALDPDLRGYQQGGRIVINPRAEVYGVRGRRFDNPRLTLETLVHELRHAYQHQAVNQKLDVPNRDVWAENFRNYIHSSVSPEYYFSQPVEVDARGFAGLVMENLL